MTLLEITFELHSPPSFEQLERLGAFANTYGLRRFRVDEKQTTLPSNTTRPGWRRNPGRPRPRQSRHPPSCKGYPRSKTSDPLPVEKPRCPDKVTALFARDKHSTLGSAKAELELLRIREKQVCVWKIRGPKKVGAPAWDREPRKAQSQMPVSFFTPARRIIHRGNRLHAVQIHTTKPNNQRQSAFSIVGCFGPVWMPLSHRSRTVATCVTGYCQLQGPLLLFAPWYLRSGREESKLWKANLSGRSHKEEAARISARNSAPISGPRFSGL